MEPIRYRIYDSLRKWKRKAGGWYIAWHDKEDDLGTLPSFPATSNLTIRAIIYGAIFSCSSEMKSCQFAFARHSCKADKQIKNGKVRIGLVSFLPKFS